MADPLTIEPCNDLAIISILARRGVDGEAVGAVLGTLLPQGCAARFAGPDTAIGMGPGSWLLVRAGGGGDLAAELGLRLRGLASVSDQSGSYRVQRLAGAGARRLLQRGASVDLDPAAFGTGSAAVTVIAHIGVLFWQVDDRPDYRLAILRSFAASFDDWLQHAAVGLQVTLAGRCSNRHAPSAVRGSQYLQPLRPAWFLRNRIDGAGGAGTQSGKGDREPGAYPAPSA